jgi:hypothetical protein
MMTALAAGLKFVATTRHYDIKHGRYQDADS